MPGPHPAGRQDPDVQWRHSSALGASGCRGGTWCYHDPGRDHRLSRPQDIARNHRGVSEDRLYDLPFSLVGKAARSADMSAGTLAQAD